MKIKVPDLPYIEFFNIYASYIFILKHCYSGCKIYLNAINMGIYLNCFEFEPHSWRSVLDTTLFDKVCQGLATDRWFSQGTPVSSTNKTDRHDIIDILLKVALNTINLNLNLELFCKLH